jgi:hypothetical protein
LLAERGAKVVVWDRDLAPLQKAGFKPDAAEVVDVASYPSIEAAFNKALKAFGQIDILVNNAGINGPIKPTWEYPLEDCDRVIAIDMNSVFYASRLAAKHMRDRKQGRIVTVSSIAGKEGVPNISAYSAAKAGVIGFSRLWPRSWRLRCHGQLHRSRHDSHGSAHRHDRGAHPQHEGQDPHGPPGGGRWWRSWRPGSPVPPAASPPASCSTSPVAAPPAGSRTHERQN